ncbi:MAG: hypothetical protein Q9222_003387 [Ikaeria aurantiellina]
MSCGNTYRYYYDSSPSNSWTRKYRLIDGTGWQSHYERTGIVLEILSAIALCGIAVWAVMLHRRAVATRKIFPWYIVALGLITFAFTWGFIDRVLNEEAVCVERLYIIFEIIFYYFRFLGDALLLAATFLFTFTAAATLEAITKPRVKSMTMAHLAFCGLLTLFWLILTILQLALNIQLVLDTGNNTISIADAGLKMVFVYDLLYLLATVELLFFGIKALVSPPRGNSTMNKKIPLILLIGIAAPLFVRSIWSTVIDGIYNLGIHTVYIPRTLSEQLLLANQLFYYFCTIIAFAALASAMPLLDAESRKVQDEINENLDRGGVSEIPRLAAPVAGGGLLAGQQREQWDRESGRDHSQDPIFNGAPEMRGV